MVIGDDPGVRTSSLKKLQRELGAEFGQSFGWEMARRYSGLRAEHSAVRAAAGLIDLSFDGSIKVWGSEAVQFLNGLVSNDVKGLVAGRGMRAAFLTGHGKVRALCRVLNLGPEFLILNDPQTHDKVFEYVFPFSYAGDFKVDDVSAKYRRLSLQGPNTPLILKEICFEPVPSLSEHDWFQTLVAGHQVLIVRASHTGEAGVDIFVLDSALTDVWEFILLKGAYHSIVPFGLEALDILRIEAGIPVYGIDMDETNMLLETGLQDSVSFTKGCYTGQEAVAMATYRGHVSKRLSGLAIDADVVPTPGDSIRKGGKDIGLVTSAIRSVSLDLIISLAYLKYGYFDEGNKVEIESNAGILPATVVKLPFYSSS